MLFFFIGIFGIQDKQRIIKDFNNVLCACGRLSSAELIEEYTYFHFFFLPIFKWNRRYYVRFRCCNRIFKVPEDYVSDLKDGSDIDVGRLEEMGRVDEYICPNCGAYVEKSFSYCPYCGVNL